MLIPAQVEAYGFNAQHLKLAPGFNFNNTLSVQSGDIYEHLETDMAIMLDYAYRPLSIYKNNVYQGSIIKHRLNYNLAMSMGFFDIFDVGLVAQLVSQQGFHNPTLTTKRPSSLTYGDTYLIPKVRLLDEELFSLSLSTPVSLPTGERRSFTGDRGVSVSPTLGMSLRSGNLTFLSNLGYTIRQKMELDNIEVNDEIIYGAGVMLDIITEHLITPFIEIHGRTSANNPFEVVEDKISSTSPLETDAGVKVFLSENFYVVGGAGVGLQSGHNAPVYRTFLGLGINKTHVPVQEPEERICWSRPVNNDWDDDGILNNDDWCPYDAEDFDGFQDEDGCPEASKVIFLDGDKDGVLDGSDECPNTPPEERELVKDNGCTMNPENIEFEFDSDKLTANSYKFIDPVVVFLQENEDLNLKVEGHTDSTGNAAYNVDLSIRRASTIKQYLIDHGIDGNRIEVAGFGEDRPIATNTSARGRATNRRVEFLLVRQD